MWCDSSRCWELKEDRIYHYISRARLIKDGMWIPYHLAGSWGKEKCWSKWTSRHLQLHLKKPWVRGKSLRGFSLAAMTALLMSCSPSGPRCCPWRCGQIWWMAQGLIGGYHQAGLAHWEGGGGDNEVAKILGGLLGRNSTVQYRTQVNFSLLQDLF